LLAPQKKKKVESCPSDGGRSTRYTKPTIPRRKNGRGTDTLGIKTKKRRDY